MASIRGVILDVDGTLVDSNTQHAQSWVDALAERGIHASLEEVRRKIGMGGDKLLPQVTGIAEDTPEGKALSKRRGEIFKERYLPRLHPTPGAHELLEHLRAQGLKMVVASSAKKGELDALLEVCGAHELLDDKTSTDDAEKSKPDPDIVHAALKNLAIPPGEVIMLGDTPYDVEAGTRAGVRVVAFRCGGWQDRDLPEAVAVYEDPADLLAHYEQSPFRRAPAAGAAKEKS